MSLEDWDKCCYLGCDNKVESYTMILLNGFVVGTRVCGDHWDLFGKNVAKLNGVTPPPN